MTLEREVLLTSFRMMVEIRLFETRLEHLWRQGSIRGGILLAIGQEAVAVGARVGLRSGDLVLPTYRGHHFALAWGMPLEAALAEIMGKETGCNRARGGSKHLGDASMGVYPSNGIVAANLPIACGTALSAKLDGSAQVSVAAFGEGATNQAVFHEALNLASIWDLPVIFLCENNLYSEAQPFADMIKLDDLAKRGAAYGIPGLKVDGMDVEAVADVIESAAQRARAGHGPTFIEAMTYRFCGHSPIDLETYRTKEEVAKWRERDPITLARDRLVSMGVAPKTLATIETDAADKLAQAEDLAVSAAAPDPATIGLGAASWMEAVRS